MSNTPMPDLLDELEMLGKNFSDLALLISQFLDDTKSEPHNIDRDKLVPILIVLREMAKVSQDLEGDIGNLYADAFFVLKNVPKND